MAKPLENGRKKLPKADKMLEKSRQKLTKCLRKADNKQRDFAEEFQKFHIFKIQPPSTVVVNQTIFI